MKIRQKQLLIIITSIMFLILTGCGATKDEIKEARKYLESTYEVKFKYVDSWKPLYGESGIKFKSTGLAYGGVEVICHFVKGGFTDNFLYNLHKKATERYLQGIVDEAFKGGDIKVRLFYEPNDFIKKSYFNKKGVPSFEEFITNENIGTDFHVAVTGDINEFEEQVNKLADLIDDKGHWFNIYVNYFENISSGKLDEYTFDEYKKDIVNEWNISIKKKAWIYDYNEETVVKFYNSEDEKETVSGEDEKIIEEEKINVDIPEELKEEYIRYLNNKYEREFIIENVWNDSVRGYGADVKCVEYNDIIAQVTGISGDYYDNFLHKLFEDDIKSTVKGWIDENNLFDTSVVVYDTNIMKMNYKNEYGCKNVYEFMKSDDITHTIEIIVTGDNFRNSVYNLAQKMDEIFNKYTVKVILVEKNGNIMSESLNEALITSAVDKNGAGVEVSFKNDNER